MNYLEEAQKIREELIEYRHHLHENPETGFDLPNTVNFVVEKLKSFGYEEPKVVEDSGVVVTVGSGEGKVILLRADMDALPIQEESGVPFASDNGKMHACGHDLHTTMLLGAAKLLKENEANLKGTVKLLFQPAEELLYGGQVMVEAGVLEDPKVDVAVAQHVWPHGPAGFEVSPGPMCASANNFKITVHGVGTHGAIPEDGVDPVYIAAQIVIGVQEIITREVPYAESAALTMGRIVGEGAVNVIPPKVEIEGTFRTFSLETQKHLKKRFVEVVESIAQTYRGTAEVEYLCDTPPLNNDPALTEELSGYLHELLDGEFPIRPAVARGGSEDFAFIASQVPVVFMWLNMPDEEADSTYSLHHPKVILDETKMPYGVAGMCYMATRWLEDNQ